MRARNDAGVDGVPVSTRIRIIFPFNKKVKVNRGPNPIPFPQIATFFPFSFIAELHFLKWTRAFAPSQDD